MLKDVFGILVDVENRVSVDYYAGGLSRQWPEVCECGKETVLIWEGKP